MRRITYERTPAKGYATLINLLLMAVFFGAIGIIPIAWFVIGIKTYGTGDYHQP